MNLLLLVKCFIFCSNNRYRLFGICLVLNFFCPLFNIIRIYEIVDLDGAEWIGWEGMGSIWFHCNNLSDGKMESLNRKIMTIKQTKLINQKEGLKHLFIIIYHQFSFALFSVEKETPVHHFISDDLVTFIFFFYSIFLIFFSSVIHVRHLFFPS